MYARRAARSISAVALAGGLSVGLGLTAPTASAMPAPEDTTVSIGSLCQQAVRGLESHEGAPSTQDGLPGLRCGQTFGAAKSSDVSGDKAHEHEGTTVPTDDFAEETQESEHEADESDEPAAEESEYDVEDRESDDESEVEEYEDDAEEDDAEEDESEESEGDDEDSDDGEDSDGDHHEHGEDHDEHGEDHESDD